MSWAIRALLLLRLEARQGEWQSVADLADHIAVNQAAVREQLAQLAAGWANVALSPDRAEPAFIQAACIHPRRDDETPDVRPKAQPPGLERIERPAGALVGGFAGAHNPQEMPA